MGESEDVFAYREEANCCRCETEGWLKVDVVVVYFFSGAPGSVDVVAMLGRSTLVLVGQETFGIESWSGR